MAKKDGSCLVQSRDTTYSGQARFPMFATANTWPTPTPSSSPSPSPDLSRFGRLAASGSSSSSAPDSTGGIVGGVVGAVVIIVGALVGVRYFQRQKQLEAKREELERQAKESVGVNPIALDIKKQFAPSTRPGRK